MTKAAEEEEGEAITPPAASSCPSGRGGV